MKLIFEKSKTGRKTDLLPEPELPIGLPSHLMRADLKIPEVSELQVIRHFTELSRRNFGIDNGFYPLGSCTMKYNPRINEDVARMPGFLNLHPYQDENQGALEIMHTLQKDLCEITGMETFSLQPAAGAHGELTGLMIFKAYFKERGENRIKILAPDSSHGTNPATATICGFETISVKTSASGGVDIEDLRNKMQNDVAGIMLTNPNTLGLFDENIILITEIVHAKGGLCYYDGANLNAIMGYAKPGEMGFDVIHVNLHKSFSTPHGGGGPGAGPVGVKEGLKQYLPRPIVKKEGDNYVLDYAGKQSIGQVRAFYGNFGVLLRAYTYIKANGAEGLKKVSENAVLNANYIKEKLKVHYNLPFDRICQHEFVLDDSKMPNGVTTNDLSKRILDFGMHAPTVYFPLIVHGAIMIEPPETESKEDCDNFIEVMIKIKDEAQNDPDIVKTAPHTTPVKKLDTVAAARKPVLKWTW